MSIQLMSQVWDLQVSGTTRMVLFCLCDHADDNGSCWPSIPTIAYKVGINDRQVQYVINELKKSGVVSVLESGGRGPGSTNVIAINLDAIPKKPIPDGPTKISTKKRREFVSSWINSRGPQCYICGGSGDEENGPDGERWHIDRIKPGSSGGAYVQENMALACARCNQSKGAKGAFFGDKGAFFGDKGAEAIAPEPSIEPPYSEPPVVAVPPKPLPRNGPAQAIVAVYCDVAGIDQPVSYSKAVGQAQMLVKAGITANDIPALYEFVSEWANGVDLGLMLNQADKWRARKPKPKITDTTKMTPDEQLAWFASPEYKAECERRFWENMV